MQLSKSFRYCLLVFLVFTLVQCTITKRVHHAGWHISWKKRSSASMPDRSEKAYTFQKEKREKTDSTENEILSNEAANEVAENKNPKDSIIARSNDPVVTFPKQERFLKQNGIQLQDHQQKAKDEPIPEPEVKPEKSRRFIPLALAIIITVYFTSTLLFASFALSLVLYGFLSFVFSGEILAIMIASLIGLGLMYLIIYLTMHLYDRRETIYESKKRRNEAYWLYSLYILCLPAALTVYLFLYASFW